jgi:hypothetical protein
MTPDNPRGLAVDVDRLRSLLASAVPVPWAICREPPNEYWFAGATIGAKSPSDARRICDVVSMGARGDDMLPLHQANASLIEEGINALPTLLNERAELLARCEGMEAVIARLKVECRLKTGAIDRWVPCPDHRDKTERGVCQVCRAERAEAKLAAIAIQQAGEGDSTQEGGGHG